MNTNNRPSTVLLLGEVDCGKTTLINTAANYFKGGSLKSLKVVVPTRFLTQTEEQFGVAHTKSKTFHTKNFKSFHFNNPNHSVTFVDTPGFNEREVNGLIQIDCSWIRTVVKAVHSTPSISAIALVINGTQTRLSPSFQKSLSQLRKEIPEALFKEVVLIFTNCNEHSCNFEMDSTEWSKNNDNTFYVNNSAFSKDPHSWNYFIDTKLASDWTASLAAVEAICLHLSSRKPVQTNKWGLWQVFYFFFRLLVALIASERTKLLLFIAFIFCVGGLCGGLFVVITQPLLIGYLLFAEAFLH